MLLLDWIETRPVDAVAKPLLCHNYAAIDPLLRFSARKRRHSDLLELLATAGHLALSTFGWLEPQIIKPVLPCGRLLCWYFCQQTH